MSGFKADYRLQNGYIHNWLVAGPQAVPVPDLDRYPGDDFKLQIARHYYEQGSGISQPPVDTAKFQLGDTELTWRYVRCDDDHFVDVTAFYHTCHYLRTWAYAQVECAQAQEVSAVLTTNGPADLWLNGRHIHRQEHFYHQIPNRVSFPMALQQGENEILIRFEEVASRECPYAMALQLPGLPEAETRVLVPINIDLPEQRRALEQAFAAAYLDRDVYAEKDDIVVHWSESLGDATQLALRLQQPSEWIYAEAPSLWVRPGFSLRLPGPQQVPEGPFNIFLMPDGETYYIKWLRLTRTIPLYTTRSNYSQAPYGKFEERRQEALLAASRRQDNVYAEIAKMALGQWTDVDCGVIEKAIAGINGRGDCSDFYLVGLLGMMYRYGDDPAFPEALRQPLEECVLGFRYWMDEPGADAMCFWSENHQILFHACEVLAGQLFPERTFGNAGQSGQWHREKGERLALSWLRKRGAGGFQEWDSNTYFEEDLLALSHLADLAENEEVMELASVVMDKMFFSIALNSYLGVFGSTHGRSYTPYIRGGRLEPTSGITRLMWGMGSFNERIMGTVALACAEGYELPEVIHGVGINLLDECWSRERHAGTLEEACDRATGSWEINKVTYKTPDYMLCSAQDYRPGQPGYQQHIWQATMGPDAVVFVSHPPCLSQEGSHRPNCWHGNVVLPRVAQWKDVLVAVHNMPEDDWLGFTHAYFPLHLFDACDLREGWAFARQGKGYLALTAARGLELIRQGDNAFRELRSYGAQNVWLCQMGREALDGSFRDFQEKVLRNKPVFGDLSVELTSLRGERIAFAWEGPLTVDGQEQPIGGFKHYESPYSVVELGAKEMDIFLGDQGIKLGFE